MAAMHMRWVPATSLTMEGRGFEPGLLATPFDRLPASAEAVVRPPVWDLSLHSAGICVRFRTDATNLSCRWALRNAGLAMPHMPSSGVSGVDLYALTEAGWRFLRCGVPAEADGGSQEMELWSGGDSVPSE